MEMGSQIRDPDSRPAPGHRKGGIHIVGQVKCFDQKLDLCALAG